MAYAISPETQRPGHTVRTWTMPEYQASHPRTPAFPPVSETATRAVMITLWVLIAMGIVLVALEWAGLTS